MRGEESIAALCRREGIAANLYYRWSKKFLEAGKTRLNGDTVREATSDEVKVLRSENRELKEVVEVRQHGESGVVGSGGGKLVWQGRNRPTAASGATCAQPV